MLSNGGRMGILNFSLDINSVNNNINGGLPSIVGVQDTGVRGNDGAVLKQVLYNSNTELLNEVNLGVTY